MRRETRTLFDVLIQDICLVSVHWRLITVGTVQNEGCGMADDDVHVTIIYAGKSLKTTQEAS